MNFHPSALLWKTSSSKAAILGLICLWVCLIELNRTYFLVDMPGIMLRICNPMHAYQGVSSTKDLLLKQYTQDCTGRFDTLFETVSALRTCGLLMCRDAFPTISQANGGERPQLCEGWAPKIWHILYPGNKKCYFDSFLGSHSRSPPRVQNPQLSLFNVYILPLFSSFSARAFTLDIRMSS